MLKKFIDETKENKQSRYIWIINGNVGEENEKYNETGFIYFL